MAKDKGGNVPDVAGMKRDKADHAIPADEMASRIRAQRNALGLSLPEMAAKLGVAKGTYAQYEHGTRYPTVTTLVRMKSAGFKMRAIVPELIEGK